MNHYHISVLYNPEKANVIADALSRMNMASLFHIDEAKKHLVNKYYG